MDCEPAALLTGRMRTSAPANVPGLTSGDRVMTAISEDLDVHVSVQFDEIPGTVLHYRTTLSAAVASPAAGQAHRLARASIDSVVSKTLPPLPCAALWE